MCMAVVKRAQTAKYSYFIAVNREEKNFLQWKTWGFHWSAYPDCYGCLDIASGGSWIAVNEHTVLAILINRERQFETGQKSRAYIVLKALHNARNATTVISRLQSTDWSGFSPFNIVVVDKKSAYCYSNYGGKFLNKTTFKCGLMMVNRSDPNDFSQVRIKYNWDRFLAANEPNPPDSDYTDWFQILSTRCFTNSPDTELGMTLISDDWRTLSSTIVSIPSNGSFPEIMDFEVI